MRKLFKVLLHLYKNWYRYWVKFLTIIGDVKLYKTPFFILYNNEEYDYCIRGHEIREIQKMIEPGDIVLRHYKHYLDGVLIPGYFSHSSIYIGNNEIIHAIAEGVQKIDLIDFCQCDGILVLRPIKGQKEAVEFAKTCLGKPYDFKFNSIDSSAFYCHELTANCYPELNIIKFKPSFMGYVFKTLRPKYLAESFTSNPNFFKIIEFKY